MADDPTTRPASPSPAGGLPRSGRPQTAVLAVAYAAVVAHWPFAVLLALVPAAAVLGLVAGLTGLEVLQPLEAAAQNLGADTPAATAIGVLAQVVQLGVILLLTRAFLGIFHRSSLRGILGAPQWGRVATALAAGGLLGACQLAVFFAAFPQDEQRLASSPDWGSALVAPLFVLPALGEEIAFRAYLLRLVETAWGAVVGLVFSSAVFALAHFTVSRTAFDPRYAVLLFLFGLLFGYAFLRTRSVWICAALHAGWNAGSTLVASATYIGGTPSYRWLDQHEIDADYLTVGALMIGAGITVVHVHSRSLLRGEASGQSATSASPGADRRDALRGPRRRRRRPKRPR